MTRTADPTKLATRTIMTIVNGSATIHRYTAAEMTQVFPPPVLAHIDAGDRAFHHTRHAKNIVVFDVILAAMKQNADLFANVTRIEQ